MLYLNDRIFTIQIGNLFCILVGISLCPISVYLQWFPQEGQGTSVLLMPRLQLWLETRPQSFLQSFIFLFGFLDRSDAIVKSLQVGSNLSGHPALPWEADPKTGSIPSGNFSWSSGSNHWFCLASCSFSSYSSKFSFSKYFLMSMTEIYSNLKATCTNTAALLCCENLPWTSHRWKVSRVPTHIRWQLF